jgi:uncharacterized protein (UPF0335 family)
MDKIMTEYQNNVDQKLKRFVENIEKLEEEKKEISGQISDVYKEAKTAGFDAGIIRKIVALRKLDEDKRIELEQMMATYKEALGMVD